MFSLIEGSRAVHLAHHKSPYIRILLLALLTHLLLFALTPQFSFTPYQLEKEKYIMVVPPPVYEDPPPPEENQLPVNTIVGMEEDGDDDEVIPPTMYGDAELIPKGRIILDERSSTEFHAFDESPILIHYEKPVYPEFARESGVEGLVWIKVTINREGKVVDAVVLDSEVTLDMEKSALKAAGECLFKPGKQRGKPVPVMVVIPFAFRLSDCR